MMKRNFLRFAASGLVCGAIASASTGAVFAQEAADIKNDPEYRQAMNNLAHEHAICVAFYIIGGACFKDKADAQTREHLKKISTSMLELAAMFTKEARLKRETLSARLEMAGKEQRKDINDDCGNISILLNKHGESCKALSEDPVSRFEKLYEPR